MSISGITSVSLANGATSLCNTGVDATASLQNLSIVLSPSNIAADGTNVTVTSSNTSAATVSWTGSAWRVIANGSITVHTDVIITVTATGGSSATLPLKIMTNKIQGVIPQYLTTGNATYEQVSAPAYNTTAGLGRYNNAPILHSNETVKVKISPTDIPAGVNVSTLSWKFATGLTATKIDDYTYSVTTGTVTVTTNRDVMIRSLDGTFWSFNTIFFGLPADGISAITCDDLSGLTVVPTENYITLSAFGTRSTGVAAYSDVLFSIPPEAEEFVSITRSVYGKAQITGLSETSTPITVTATARDTFGGTYTSTASFTVAVISPTSVTVTLGPSPLPAQGVGTHYWSMANYPLTSTNSPSNYIQATATVSPRYASSTAVTWAPLDALGGDSNVQSTGYITVDNDGKIRVINVHASRYKTVYVKATTVLGNIVGASHNIDVRAGITGMGLVYGKNMERRFYKKFNGIASVQSSYPFSSGNLNTSTVFNTDATFTCSDANITLITSKTGNEHNIYLTDNTPSVARSFTVTGTSVDGGLTSTTTFYTIAEDDYTGNVSNTVAFPEGVYTNNDGFAHIVRSSTTADKNFTVSTASAMRWALYIESTNELQALMTTTPTSYARPLYSINQYIRVIGVSTSNINDYTVRRLYIGTTAANSATGVSALSVSGDNSTSTVNSGSSITLGANSTSTSTVYPTDVVFTVSDSSIATITQVNGTSATLTGVSSGTVTVTATSATGGFTSTRTFTIVVPTISVTSVSAVSGASSVFVGSTITLSASVSPADATNKTITWLSGATGTATVDASTGVVTGIASGTATITATTSDGSFTATKSIVVTKPVTSISAVSGASTVGIGSTITLSASVSPADATVQTITWSSDAIGTATVDASTGVVTGIASGTATITATTSDGSFTATKSIVVTKPVTSISAVSGASTVLVGSTITLSASVSPADATVQTITWLSGATGTATVDASTGVVTGVASGTATITATTADGGFTATKSITVTTAPVAVSGISAISGSSSVSVGSTITLSASVTPGNATNKTIMWSSDAIGTATVNSSTGVVTGVSVGTATITATTAEGTHTATKEITVAPALTGFSITYDGGVSDFTVFTKYAGQELQFYASPVPSNATLPTVSWSSSDDTIATVNSDGLVTAVAAGTVTITVSNPDGSITASSVGTIQTPPVAATDFTLTTDSGYLMMRKGTPLVISVVPMPSNAFIVTYNFSSSSDKADVGTTSVPYGSASVGATVLANSGDTAIVNVTLYTYNAQIQKTFNIPIFDPFTGFAAPVLAIYDNTAGGQIHASDEININRTSRIELRASIFGSEGASSDITYSSSNTSVLAKEIDKNGNESDEVFSVVGAGTTVITAAVYGESLTQSITVVDETFVDLSGFSVAPASGGSSSISYGSTVQLTATPVPANASYTTPYWQLVSTTSEGASIDPYTGVLTGGSTVGEVVVRAYYSTGGPTQEFTVTVSAPTNPVTGISAITATDNLTYVAPGLTLALSTSVSPVDAGNQTINWTSSDTTKATVNSSGVVSGVALGNVTITATAAGNTSYTSTYALRIGVPVSGINGISGAASVPKGQTTQLTTSVTPGNASVTGITWSSSDSAVATVNSATGLVTTVEGGEVTITATTTEGSYSTTYALTVVVLPQEVSGISDPSGNLDMIRVPIGGSVQFSGVFSPANTTNKAMNWQSYHPQFATVDASGLVTGVARGTAGIVGRSAQNTGLQRLATVTVYVPVTGMNSITHNGASDEIQLGQSLNLSCAGVIPSTAENTRYSWSTSHPAYVVVSSRTLLLIVSNAMPDNSFTVTATSEDGGFTATKTFTIYRPVGGVGSITAPNRSMVVGLNTTLQLTLPILPSNATNQTVNWTSSNTARVTVNSSGLCSGVGLTQKKEVVTITASITEPTTNTTFTRTYGLTVPVNKITGFNAITVTNSPVVLLFGQTYQLNTAIAPSNASYAHLGYTWTSSNPSVATIDSSGSLTVVGSAKNVKITATAVGDLTGAKKKTTRSFTVITNPSSIEATTSTGGHLVARGKKIIVKPNVLPTTASNRKVTYTSSNPAIAVVASNGNVTGVAVGSVTITIASVSLPSITTTVSITVY
jgi:uncharacterized protein YjdB